MVFESPEFDILKFQCTCLCYLVLTVQWLPYTLLVMFSICYIKFYT
jgi:hypothetical protein